MPDKPEQAQRHSDLPLDDLVGAGLNELLDQDPASDYNNLYGKLAKAAGNAKAAGDLAKEHALGFIAAIASMMLTPTEKSAPFQALAHWNNGGRSFIPEDLTPAQVDLAALLADAVNHQLLRARLADLVWMKDRSKGIAYPCMAIDAYRTHPINFETWHLSGQAVWHRALGLAISLGRGAGNRAAEIEAALLDAFDRALGADTFEPMFYVQPPRPHRADSRRRADGTA